MKNLIIATTAAAIALAAVSVAPLRASDGIAAVESLPDEEEDPKLPEGALPLKLKTTVRPRLIFNAEFIAQLKKNAAIDPVLQNSVDSVVSWAKRAKFKPTDTPAEATDDQSGLVSFGRIPDLAFAYAIDPDPVILENIRQFLENMTNSYNWTEGVPEVDSSMGAGNNMATVAILFDAAYNGLDPEFRAKVAEKLFQHARRMYFLGYKGMGPGFPGKGYWTADPMNNHRWHRGCGQSAALIAVAGEPKIGARADFFLSEAKNELELILKYFSKEGDYSEGSGYQTFGFMYLMLSAWMFDRNFDTDYLKTTPGFRYAWRQQVHFALPSTAATFGFGDDSNGNAVMGNLNGSFLLGPLISRDKDAFASYMKFYNDRRLNPRYMDRPPPAYPWSFMLFYDPSLRGGDPLKEPLIYYIQDLGAVSFFDTWEKDAVVFTFKCGPLGGYSLNEFRHDVPAGTRPRYLNLAHNDPDANSIALGKSGYYFLHPGNYSMPKWTANISTMLVNGKGQKQEGDDYTQPSRTGADMREFSYLTGWKKDAQNRVIVEGEAGNAYKDLDKYRRTCVWIPGSYILVLDDVVAKQPVRLDWHGIGRFFFVDAAQGKSYITPSGPGNARGQKDDLKIPTQFRSNKPATEVNAAIEFYSMAGRWDNPIINALDLTVNDKAFRSATLFDAWNKNASVEFAESDDKSVVTVTVKGNGINDTWTWTPTADRTIPSNIAGKRGAQPLIEMTAADIAPRDGWNPASVTPPDDPFAAAKAAEDAKAKAAADAAAKAAEEAAAKAEAAPKPKPAAKKPAQEKLFTEKVREFFEKLFGGEE